MDGMGIRMGMTDGDENGNGDRSRLYGIGM